MSGVDITLTKKEERVQQREQIQEECRRREEIRKQESALTASCCQQSVLPEDSDEDSDTEQQDTDQSDYEVEIPVYHRKQLEDVSVTRVQRAKSQEFYQMYCHHLMCHVFWTELIGLIGSSQFWLQLSQKPVEKI